MQIDMHFHATHAIALLAGLSKEDALIVATAAEFVDNATENNSEETANREILFAISTAHHLAESVLNSWTHKQKHRLVWVPFHFLPGGEGNTLEEKLLCVKNSDIAKEMFEHHIKQSDKEFYYHLLGIASHVYLDTFSHYGFSGIASKLNEIAGKSIKFEVKDEKIKNHIVEKAMKFAAKYGNEALEFGSKGLGHGAVATYPDRPYLTWEFEYEHSRGKNNRTKFGPRPNPETFFEGLKELHHYLSQATSNTSGTRSFSQVEDEIRGILATEGKKQERCDLWIKFIKKHFNEESIYPGDDWNKEKDEFENSDPSKGVGECYRFHQAAAIHRWYVMKDLLPKHKIYCL